MDEERINQKMNEIDKKLKNNPKLIEVINNHIFSIEEILETNIQVNILFFDDYNEHINEMNNSLFIEEKNYNDTITLEEFLGFFYDEEKNLKVLFDPIYLKKGLNEIKNLLITTVEDKIIIVPKTNKNEEKK